MKRIIPLSLTLLLMSTMFVNAAEENAMVDSYCSIASIPSDFCNLGGKLANITEEDGAEPRLFEKQYKVVSDRVTMRSGPGTSYSAEGTLYKDDILYVKSISNGWAKFKVNGVWRYVPESSIERV